MPAFVENRPGGPSVATFAPISMFFGVGWEHMMVDMFIVRVYHTRRAAA